MENVKELYEIAIQKYGFDAQLDQLTEECAELIVACNKFRRNSDDCIAGIIDELADVEIMVEQIKYALSLNSSVDSRKDYKLKRLQKRLQNV